MTFRQFRLATLLTLLISVAVLTWWESWRVTQWNRPLNVVIYPIPGSQDAKVAARIASLDAKQFAEIGSFIINQSARYRSAPVPRPNIVVGHAVAELPPRAEPGARSAWDNLLLSLKLRYFAFRNAPFFENIGRIRLFVIYHAGDDGVPLAHSLGLQKGLFGVVHVFADEKQQAQNNLVITHELMHTLGATDKYDAELNPIWPQGFAEPEDAPRYPQHYAEIMGGRIPVSPAQARIPPNLSRCVIGYKTAREINW